MGRLQGHSHSVPLLTEGQLRKAPLRDTGNISKIINVAAETAAQYLPTVGEALDQTALLNLKILHTPQGL